MALLGFIAQIILIFLIVHAASNRPGSTTGQRWGIGIGVLVLTKAVSFGIGFAVLAALPAAGIPVHEGNTGMVYLVADMLLGIITVIAGYLIAKAIYDRVCGPKARGGPDPRTDSGQAEV